MCFVYLGLMNIGICIPRIYFSRLSWWSASQTPLFHSTDTFILEEAEYTICSIIEKLINSVNEPKIVFYVSLFCNEPQKTKRKHIIYEAEIMCR